MRAVLVSLAAALGLVAMLAHAPGGEKKPGLTDKELATRAPRAVLVIHGGAGVLTEEEMKGEKLEGGEPLTKAHYQRALARALRAGHAAWGAKKSSALVVEAAVRVMEDSELFNAGRGAALNEDGRA